jgi:hypothetical protein
MILFVRRKQEKRVAEQVAEKVVIFDILSEARNPSEGYADEKKERFLASLGMTKS